MWCWHTGHDGADVTDGEDEGDEAKADMLWDWSCGRDDGAVEDETMSSHVEDKLSELMWTWTTPLTDVRSAAEQKEIDMWDWSARAADDEKAIVSLRGVAYKCYASANEWASFNAPLLHEHERECVDASPLPPQRPAVDAEEMWCWHTGHDGADVTDGEDEGDEAKADMLWDWSCGRDDGAVEDETMSSHVEDKLSELMWTWTTPLTDVRSAAEQKEIDMWDWSARAADDEKAIVSLRGVAYKCYASANEWASFNAPLL